MHAKDRMENLPSNLTPCSQVSIPHKLSELPPRGQAARSMCTRTIIGVCTEATGGSYLLEGKHGKIFPPTTIPNCRSEFIANEPEKWNFSSACSPSDLRLKLFTLILMLQRMLYQLLSTKLEALHVLLSIGIKATN